MISKLLLFFCLAFLFTNTTYCQKDSSTKVIEKIASNASIKLQQKILLSDDQTTEVKNLLIDYLTKMNIKKADSTLLLNNIKTVLSARQKSKFDIIKTEWWEYVEKEISSSIKK